MSDMIRDDKRTEELKLRLTERELLDLTRLSMADDRSPTEYVTKLLRSSMYGSVATKLASLQGPDGPAQGRSGPVRTGEGR